MKFSSREVLLGWGTAVVVVLLVTYAGVAPQVTAWREAQDTEKKLHRQERAAREAIARKAKVDMQFEALRQPLPRHPADRDVTAEMLKALERLAQEQGLTLTRREPDKEKQAGDLFELSVHCTWEASLSTLVHFLYALQSQGAMFDIRQLTVTPTPGTPDRLKGNLTVDCAYSREAAGAPADAGRPAKGQH